jgi:hypothetical protein
MAHVQLGSPAGQPHVVGGSPASSLMQWQLASSSAGQVQTGGPESRGPMHSQSGSPGGQQLESGAPPSTTGVGTGAPGCVGVHHAGGSAESHGSTVGPL